MKNILIKILKYLVIFLFTFTTVNVIVLTALKYFNPPTSAFIELKRSNTLYSFEIPDNSREWLKLSDISPSIVKAVIASEDQRFTEHMGFDFEQISKAVKDIDSGRRVRGASTITQQTAKNLFLWSSKSLFRKGVEAYYSFLIELLWSKERILEVYLNIIEFGKEIYGVEKAASYYFNRSAKHLNNKQAAMLASILPNPLKLNPNEPSNYLLNRQANILKQMQNLEGSETMKKLLKK